MKNQPITVYLTISIFKQTMEEKSLVVVEQPQNVQTASVLIIEQFLNDNYRLRRNMLSGKVEFKSRAEVSADFRPLTQEALNSIIIHALREGLDEACNPKTDITMYVNSEEVRQYNPVLAFLNDLPQWDGQNHVARLFSRIPGISSEQLAYLSIWLRSAVAHWLQLDTLHGNEVVPVLIGAQGCGKTTFLRRLLPHQLREYYLDHLNLSNKFDKEMALTNNLLVNLDELEAIRPSQHAALKQTLSKNKVNGRPIFGKAQDDRPRYASFVSTTNNPHPLTDATGSRRYICLSIPKGQLIDNTGDIDYEQLYAQVLHEIRVLETPYWFNNEEVARIQQMNLAYMQQKDIAEMVKACFRKPADGEKVKSLNTTEMLEIIRDEYPNVTVTTKAKVELGRVLVSLDFERKEHSHVAYYKAVPLRAA
jgi:predicted P-loop ATPase